MMKRKLPTKLYKYQSYNNQNLDNLKNRVLWFSKPERFNDPYDCSIPFILPDKEDITDVQWEKIWNKTREVDIDKKKFDEDYLTEGKVNDKFKNKVSDASQKATISVMHHYQNRGVACFAERVNDILMWSHYADGHRGFCLEFDTSFDPFQKAVYVIYSDSYPILNPATILLSRKPRIPISPLRTKSKCWKYEKEWRILHTTGDTEYGVDWHALTGVYFGCAMSYVHKEIIALILAGSPTALYEMKRSEKDYSLSLESVVYKSYEYK